MPSSPMSGRVMSIVLSPSPSPVASPTASRLDKTHLQKDIIANTRQNMSKFLMIFDDWSSQLQSSLQSTHLSHKNIMSEQDEEVQQWTNEKLSLQQQQQQQSTSIKGLRHQLQTLQAQVSELEAKSTAMPPIIEQLEQEQHFQQQQQTNQNKSLKSRLETQQKELNRLRQSIQPYQQALGLIFRSQPEGFEMNFTQIDPMHPVRVFRVCVCVNECDQYIMTACEPDLGTEGETLIEQLNQSDDENFCLFMVNIRKAFRRQVVN